MRVVIEYNKKEDFPSAMSDNPDFFFKMEKSIRRRLDLRMTDQVIFREYCK